MGDVVTNLPSDLTRFDAIETSWVLRHHECWRCTGVRQLIRSRLLQHVDLASQLAAIPAAVPWGPVAWPAHWCDLEHEGGFRGDCGVHAHLAHQLLDEHGVQHARGRAAIRVTDTARRNWRVMWGSGPHEVPAPWIGEELIHHEVVRVGSRWWDPTQASWFGGLGARLTAGPVVALRVDGGTWQVLSS
jgi:hypothetical protein